MSKQKRDTDLQADSKSHHEPGKIYPGEWTDGEKLLALLVIVIVTVAFMCIVATLPPIPY